MHAKIRLLKYVKIMCFEWGLYPGSSCNKLQPIKIQIYSNRFNKQHSLLMKGQVPNLILVSPNKTLFQFKRNLCCIYNNVNTCRIKDNT